MTLKEGMKTMNGIFGDSDECPTKIQGDCPKKKITAESLLRFLSLNMLSNVECIQLPRGIHGLVTVLALHQALPKLTTILTRGWISVTGETINVRISPFITQLAFEVFRYGKRCGDDETFVKWQTTSRVKAVQRNTIEEYSELEERRVRRHTEFFINQNM